MPLEQLPKHLSLFREEHMEQQWHSTPKQPFHPALLISYGCLKLSAGPVQNVQILARLPHPCASVVTLACCCSSRAHLCHLISIAHFPPLYLTEENINMVSCDWLGG